MNYQKIVEEAVEEASRQWEARPKGRMGPVGWESFQGLDTMEANHYASAFNRLPKKARQWALKNNFDWVGMDIECHHKRCRSNRDGPFIAGVTVRCPDCDYEHMWDAAASHGEVDHIIANHPGQPFQAVYKDGSRREVRW